MFSPTRCVSSCQNVSSSSVKACSAIIFWATRSLRVVEPSSVFWAPVLVHRSFSGRRLCQYLMASFRLWGEICSSSMIGCHVCRKSVASFSRLSLRSFSSMRKGSVYNEVDLCLIQSLWSLMTEARRLTASESRLYSSMDSHSGKYSRTTAIRSSTLTMKGSSPLSSTVLHWSIRRCRCSSPSFFFCFFSGN